MDRPNLGALFLHFLMLSFLAIGGAPTVLPDMHRYVVEAHHWMTSTQFAEVYALAQVAPGPNIMYVTLIGWQVAGWAGAAATTLPWLVPASTLTLLIGHLHSPLSPGRAWSRHPARPDADYDRTDARERVDTDARGEPRLARVPAHATHGGDGPAHAMEPAVAAGRWRAGGHGRARLSTPVARPGVRYVPAFDSG